MLPYACKYPYTLDFILPKPVGDMLMMISNLAASNKILSVSCQPGIPINLTTIFLEALGEP